MGGGCNASVSFFDVPLLCNSNVTTETKLKCTRKSSAQSTQMIKKKPCGCSSGLCATRRCHECQNALLVALGHQFIPRVALWV